MCPNLQKGIKAFYVAEDITEIELPSDLQDLPELGDNPESGIIGYILIANREEITIICNEVEYLTYISSNPQS